MIILHLADDVKTYTRPRQHVMLSVMLTFTYLQFYIYFKKNTYNIHSESENIKYTALHTRLLVYRISNWAFVINIVITAIVEIKINIMSLWSRFEKREDFI